MTNDEDQTATGTIALETRYERELPPSAEVLPAAKQTGIITLPNAETGALALNAGELFDNPGEGAVITAAVFSTRQYYRFPYSGIGNGVLWLMSKYAPQLSAMSPRPPSPFTVDVAVTMTNGKGQTATGTFTFKTTYEFQPQGPAPTARSSVWQTPPGQTTRLEASGLFDNPGANARFTEIRATPGNYYNNLTINSAGAIMATVKTAAELNAMSPRPPNPISVPANVTMTNDGGHTVTVSVTLETTYERAQ